VVTTERTPVKEKPRAVVVFVVVDAAVVFVIFQYY